MNIKLITFGSHDNYLEAAKRLTKQANELNIFTETILYNPEYLKKFNDFWGQHSDFINSNKRGYGYWLWKPYIIKKTMESMNNSDILFYLDCGCELSCNKKNIMLECIESVKNGKKILAVECQTSLEKNWTKMDLIEKLNMNQDIYIYTKQIQAGAILFFVCDETRQLVNDWYNISCEYSNLDDSPSVIKNHQGFREHRHDQSIFSLLIKKNKIFSTQNLRIAVNYIRNISGVSRLIKCVRSGCRYIPNRVNNNNYCCIKCEKNGNHGALCQKILHIRP